MIPVQPEPLDQLALRGLRDLLDRLEKTEHLDPLDLLDPGTGRRRWSSWTCGTRWTDWSYRSGWPYWTCWARRTSGTARRDRITRNSGGWNSYW